MESTESPSTVFKIYIFTAMQRLGVELLREGTLKMDGYTYVERCLEILEKTCKETIGNAIIGMVKESIIKDLTERSQNVS